MKYLGLVFLFYSSLAHAGSSMDLDTHNTLIEKIEKGKSVNNSVEIDLRLADLYSDRSRILQIQEEEKNCKNCMKSDQDRRKSLSIYHRIFDKLDREQQERVFVQVSKTHILLNENKTAKSFHNKVIRGKSYHGTLKALAHLSEAEQKFFAQKYGAAHKDFKKAVKLNSKLNTPLTRYRMAWCEFNSGQYMVAKKHLANLLASNESMDDQLRVDISRDYAKFSAKGPIKHADLSSVHKLSPEAVAMANLEILATELDRLGRPHENLDANNYIIENFKMSEVDKAFAYLRMSQAEQTLKRNKKTIDYFSKSSEFYKKTDCKELEFRCNEFKDKAKKFLVFWNKVEKDKPSQTLLSVWSLYLATFPENFEMHYVAGQTFHKVNKYDLALTYLLAGASAIHQQKKKQENSKLFVATLELAMSVAEESKRIDLRRKAYNGYLAVYPEGPKFIHAKYQLAYLKYEEKKYDEALASFKEVITLAFKGDGKRKAEKQIAKKSADLVLDIYALKKANLDIMEHATTYAGQFPKHQKEYKAIYRKALLHEAVASLEQQGGKKKKADLLTKMVRLSFDNMPEKEEILFLETQIRMARQLENLSEMVRSGTKLLRYKKLSISTSHFVYNQLVWAFQVSFDFKRAFLYENRRLTSGKKTKQDLVKLGMLAQLAGKNSKEFYEDYLSRGHGVLEGNRIRANMVQASRYPWKEIKTHLNKMRRSPLLLSELALETFAKYKNIRGAEEVLAHNNVAVKPAGKILKRHIEIPKFKKRVAKLTRHIISHRESRMQTDIAKRMDLMSEVEVMANEAIARKDFPLQMAALTVIKNEKYRLARDIGNLPMPRGLKAAELTQYKNILTTKINAINGEAKAIETSLMAAWKSETYSSEMRKNKDTASIHFEELIAEEASFLLPYTPEGKKSRITALTEKSKVSRKDLVAARKNAENNPFDEGKLKKLRPLEEKFGNNTHVAFIDQRLLELTKQVNP